MAEPLKRRTLAAFAAPCLPLTGVGLPMVIYLPPYYASTLGLDLAITGILFSAVRWIDLPLDIAFGHGIDRTNTRFGRFRPWIVAGGLIMLLGLYLSFFAEPGLSPLRAFLGLLVIYAGFSMAQVAHTSWGQALSTDYHERSRIFGWWQTANMIALLILLAVPPLANWLGPQLGFAATPSLGVHAMGLVLALMLAPALLAVAFGVPDRQKGSSATAHPHGWRDIWQALKQPNLRRLMLIDLLASLPPGFGGALLVFFFEAARGFSGNEARLLLLFYFVSGLIGAPFWGWLARRTSKHMAVAWAIGSYAVLHTGLVLAPNAGFWAAAAGMLLAGIPAVAPPFLVRAMLADVTDAETLSSGRSNAGLYYAVLVGVQKIGYAIPVGLAYIVLDMVGFDAKLGPGNTQTAIDGLVLLFLVPPVLCALGAAWLAKGWAIDRDAQQRIIAELHAK